MSDFNGLGTNLGNLARLSRAKSRSISAENPTGAKGAGGMATEGVSASCARDLGRGWKINPFVTIKPGERHVLADIAGPGAIQHIWMTPVGNWRHLILRIHWDGQEQPSVECPVGDFFACTLGPDGGYFASQAVCFNPGSALNCYWEMPFRKHCTITLENLNVTPSNVYFQIDYALTEVPADSAYFHAQFRRANPLPYKQVYTIVDGVKGHGQYVGTYMVWGVNNSGWWGEGEIKFYIDGDGEFPTNCGTGTEDYFCGSYNFEAGPKDKRQYQEFATPYVGMPQVIRPDGLYRSQQRFGLYRWHIPDPIRFEKDLRVTIQALGWRSEGRYLPLQDDISSVAFWYQTLPAAPFPKLPDRDGLEMI